MAFKMANAVAKIALLSAAAIGTGIVVNSSSMRQSIDTYLQRRASEQYIQEALQSIPPDISTKVTLEFKANVAYALRRLKDDDQAAILQTADWCIPCRELKKAIHERDLEGKLDFILVTNTEEERMYAQRRFAEGSIHLPRPIPGITRNYNGRIVTYTGWEQRSASMYTPEGLSVPIERILKK